MLTLADKHSDWIKLCKSTLKGFANPDKQSDYLQMKLFAECGEFIGDLCGWKFHNDDKKKAKLVDEAGDVIWYIWNIADDKGILDCIFIKNPILPIEEAADVINVVRDINASLAMILDTGCRNIDYCQELSEIFTWVLALCHPVCTLEEIEAHNMKKVLARTGGTGVYDQQKFNNLFRS